MSFTNVVYRAKARLVVSSGLSRLLRRALGVGGHALCLSAFGIGVLWLDSKRGFLQPFDGTHLGYSLLVLISVLLDSTPASNPVTLTMVGLRLTTSEGAPVPRLIRAARSLLLWVIVALPSTLRINDIAQKLPMSFREQVLASGGILVAVASLPLLTALLTLGRRAAHDWLCGCHVSEATDPAPDSSPRASTNPRLLTGAVSAIWALALTAFLVFDWRSRASTRVLLSSKEYLPKLLAAVAKRSESQNRPFTYISYQLRDEDYYDSDPFILLEGVTDYYRVLVAPVVLEQHTTRYQAGLEAAIRIIPLLPPGTRYLSIDLAANRAFGPFYLSQGYRFLLSRQPLSFRYAPTGQRSEPIKGSSPDSVTIVTEYSPKLRREVGFYFGWGMLAQWRFPSLYFYGTPLPSNAKLLG